eukprot:3288956-Rhodomonas_salina.1
MRPTHPPISPEDLKHFRAFVLEQKSEAFERSGETHGAEVQGAAGALRGRHARGSAEAGAPRLLR